MLLRRIRNLKRVTRLIGVLMENFREVSSFLVLIKVSFRFSLYSYVGLTQHQLTQQLIIVINEAVNDIRHHHHLTVVNSQQDTRGPCDKIRGIQLLVETLNKEVVAVVVVVQHNYHSVVYTIIILLFTQLFHAIIPLFFHEIESNFRPIGIFRFLVCIEIIK